MVNWGTIDHTRTRILQCHSLLSNLCTHANAHYIRVCVYIYYMYIHTFTLPILPRRWGINLSLSLSRFYYLPSCSTTVNAHSLYANFRRGISICPACIINFVSPLPLSAAPPLRAQLSFPVFDHTRGNSAVLLPRASDKRQSGV